MARERAVLVTPWESDGVLVLSLAVAEDAAVAEAIPRLAHSELSIVVRVGVLEAVSDAEDWVMIVFWAVVAPAGVVALASLAFINASIAALCCSPSILRRISIAYTKSVGTVAGGAPKLTFGRESAGVVVVVAEGRADGFATE